ncbi:hypothetical protein HanIR_Chr02g0067401 [Helianthus annuus]|nr:hypothetical protein HanIR_Chr02g0067401 [Helianthus annuus]
MLGFCYYFVILIFFYLAHFIDLFAQRTEIYKYVNDIIRGGHQKNFIRLVFSGA